MITKEYSKDLTGKNTFRMQVNCRTFIEYDSVADLFELDFEEMLKPVKHIGGGSNLLFTQDFKGTILHSKVDFIEKLPHDHVSVGAGVIFDDFCAWAAQEGLWGPENLSYIPGEVGAAAVQNIGAYGVEVKDIIKTVYAYDIEEEEFVRFDVSECGYGYRESMFKHAKDRYIITHVVFALSREPKPKLDYSKALASLKDDPQLTPGKVRDTVIAIRKEKLPEVSQVGSAGSFFKNPVVSQEVYEAVVKAAAGVEVPHYDAGEGMVKIPAAWLIEQCGWKGRRSGNAGVWEKQPLVLVNASGRALPEEIIALENKIRASVKQKFGIILDCEVEHL
ncbi:MAG: UDP-N-acetylmuramate dehydrogenase [Bacteroidales bacterium]|nr:UDP-N-acetylmuramate dehydrogenase [Bacteroidales bacterium]